MSEDGNPWTTVASRRVYDGSWISVEDRRVRDAAGRDQPYGVVVFNKVGVRILLFDIAGCTYLVGQHLYGSGRYSWQLPAGSGEHNEALLDAAQRELREEAGLAAQNWLPLLDLVPSGSVTDERQAVFVAWGFEFVPRDPDPQEVLRLRRVTVAEALSLVLDGTIRDAGTVAALAAATLKAARGELPEEVARRLLVAAPLRDPAAHNDSG